MSGEAHPTSHSLIGAFRDATFTVRGIACLVILAFGGLMTSPAVAALRTEIQTHPWHHEPTNPAAELSQTLDALHRQLDSLTSGQASPVMAHAHAVPQAGFHVQVPALDHAAVRNYLGQLAGLDEQMKAQFAATRAHLIQHHLSAVIMERERKAEAEYASRMTALIQELKAADQATDTAAFQAHLLNAKQQLDQEQVKPFHEKFDPKHLPFSVAKPTHIKPRLSKRDYELHPVVKRKPLQVAMNGPMVGLVSAGMLAPADVPANPGDPSYLAPTDDVQITPAIQAEAKALNHDPVQIYNWVHNNIEYIPTYGSIQGSDMTLQTLKGNDFDTASLLIALLRASNIPSRYVYGTIQVPIAQVENWVGGVTDPNAALNLLGQGGIPATGLVQGGQIKYVQMEHVWVEAWVNFIPSRAAKAGPGNTWVPMDASFKQYTYTQGMNLQQAVPFDASAVVQQIASTATVNTTEGWVSNVNSAYLQQQTTAYEQNVAAYLSNLEAANPNITVGDLTGTKTIVSRTAAILSAGLPYQVEAIGQRMTILANDLVWKFTYQLNDNLGNPVLTYTVPTPELDGKLLSLSFIPASQADAQTLASLLPSVPAGGTLDPSQLPKSLPGYLINVTPQVTLSGSIVATGGAYTMGTDWVAQEGYWSPQSGWQTKPSDVVTGEYHAVGVDLQGVPDSQIASLESDMQTTQSDIQAGSLSGLTGQQVVGDILQAGVLSYFDLNNNQDGIAAKVSHVVKYPLPSFGTFKLTAQTTYDFGIPHSVSFPGVTMDVGYYHSMGVADDNNQQSMAAYFSATGARLSAFEHLIPEQLFSTATQPVHGISAVKALGIAVAQGQRIYTITSANIATALPQLTVGDDVISDIQAAVNAGMVVTVSQGPVSYNGWQGTGYIIKDPATGTGAYKISGGANGGTVTIPEIANELFWALVHALGGTFGKILSGVNEIFTEITTFIYLITHCPTGQTIAGVISILLVMVGFALLIPAFEALGIVVLIIYLVFAGTVTSLLADGWKDSCKVS